MAELHLLRPFWLLAIIPLILLLLLYKRKSRKEDQFKSVVDSHLLEFLIVGQNDTKSVRPQLVLFVMLFLSILALAGPTFRQEPSPFAGDDAGLIVLMKMGSSMNSRDVQPSRLTRAKQKLQDLLELRKGKSTGLVVYSGSSHLVMVPTTDGAVITTMIEDLTPDLMPVDGDDLSGAMELGIQMLEQSESPGSILIMADTVAADQVAGLQTVKVGVPVQMHSFNPPGGSDDSGLQSVAALYSTTPVLLSIDSSDVERIAGRAAVALKQVSLGDNGLRWRDDGYWLLPFIAACFLLWFRKGWVVR